jgi:TPR repeat
LEQQERKRSEAEGRRAATSAGSALVSPAFMKIAAVVGGITLLILVVYWATRPKTPKVTGEAQQQQQPNPTVSNAPPAEETSSNNPPSTSTTSPGKLETSKPIAETTLPSRSSKKSATVATTKASKPSKPPQILPDGSKPPPTPPDPKLLDQITAAITEGDWHKKRGEYKEAISAYEKGLALDPSNPELKRKIQEARNAKEAADRSLGKNPSSQ